MRMNYFGYNRKNNYTVNTRHKMQEEEEENQNIVLHKNHKIPPQSSPPPKVCLTASFAVPENARFPSRLSKSWLVYDGVVVIVVVIVPQSAKN